MTAQPLAMSARSLMGGPGHSSHTSRLRQPWRLETPARAFLVRPARAADLPGVMGMFVRSTALSRWQWRRTRGGRVPSLSETALWLRVPGSLVVLAASSRTRAPRVVAIAALDQVVCAGGPAEHLAQAEVLVADPWQGRGLGRALVAHLAAASWLTGRRELMASEHADEDTAVRLLGPLGPMHHGRHPHGSHARVHLTADAVAGLGPLRTAALL